MRKLNAYFLTRPALTRILLWSCFALALGYALVLLFVEPTWNYYFILVPAVPCFYFFYLDKRASYDPEKDRTSDQYVPPKHRKKRK